MVFPAFCLGKLHSLKRESSFVPPRERNAPVCSFVLGRFVFFSGRSRFLSFGLLVDRGEGVQIIIELGLILLGLRRSCRRLGLAVRTWLYAGHDFNFVHYANSGESLQNLSTFSFDYLCHLIIKQPEMNLWTFQACWSFFHRTPHLFCTY